jgi:hypothetical protein
MNLTSNQKQWIAWIVLTLATLALSVTLGVRYPLPTPPAEMPDEIVALGTTNFTAIEAEDITATDDLTVTDDTTLTDALDVSGAVTLNSTVDIDGNITSGTGGISITDSLNVTSSVDFDSTANIDGAATLNSTLDVDGNISSGTGAISMTDNLDLSGTFNYGSGDLTPLAYDSTTQYEVYIGNASSVTQTTVTSATHNMTTAVDWGSCFVSDPDADANDPAYCTISISGSSITFQALDDDGDNATTAATKIYYIIIGR